MTLISQSIHENRFYRSNGRLTFPSTISRRPSIRLSGFRSTDILQTRSDQLIVSGLTASVIINLITIKQSINQTSDPPFFFNCHLFKKRRKKGRIRKNKDLTGRHPNRSPSPGPATGSRPWPRRYGRQGRRRAQHHRLLSLSQPPPSISSHTADPNSQSSKPNRRKSDKKPPLLPLTLVAAFFSSCSVVLFGLRSTPLLVCLRTCFRSFARSGWPRIDQTPSPNEFGLTTTQWFLTSDDHLIVQVSDSILYMILRICSVLATFLRGWFWWTSTHNLNGLLVNEPVYATSL